jgi:kexin
VHDDDHTIEDAIVATTSVGAAPTKTGSPEDNYIDRPVNAKPTETTELGEAPTRVPSATPTSSADSYLPSFLPTFGTSKQTQAWIYAAIAFILVFFIGLGVYFHVQRRQQIRNNPHDDYDFDVIEDDDELHPMTRQSGRTQRRGGELYNAFAGESDEELFSDEDDEPYRDQGESDDHGQRSGENIGMLEKG